jgi:hypothetical protein
MRGFFHLRLIFVTIMGGCVMACASVVMAQTNPSPSPSMPQKQQAKSKHKPKSIAATAPPRPVSAPVFPPAPQQAPSLLQEPAKPAQVKADNDELFVQAENSNLSQILKDISSATGMKLEGFSQDGRVFGNYGPGPAREILSQLLEGTGYNVLMVGGTQKSVPRELVLTARDSAHPSAMATPVPAPAAKPKPDEDEDAAEPDEEPPAPPQQRPELQPSAASPSGQVKTPQELLEELHKMHEQGQNPQQPPQNQQQSLPNQPPPQ